MSQFAAERPAPHRCRTCDQPLNAFRSHPSLPLLWFHTKDVGHAPDPVPELETTHPAQTVCDFCSEPDPAWVYRTDPPHEMVSDGIGYSDDGAWGACERCKRLIEAGNWALLTARSVELIAKLRGVDPVNETLRSDAGRLHDYFRAVYIDKPIPVAEFKGASPGAR